MNQNRSNNQQPGNRSSSRLKGWAAFLFCLSLLWGFTFYFGPWLRDSIPAAVEMTEIARERDIDTTAFFYAETKESYEGERYLREALDLAKPKGYGANGFFFLGIVLCILILAVGFHFMPNETIPEPDKND
ncbi:hypothetical protein KJ966_23950 [bacterium]|nr:hypothetical protein [bacterium]